MYRPFGPNQKLSQQKKKSKKGVNVGKIHIASAGQYVKESYDIICQTENNVGNEWNKAFDIRSDLCKN